MGHMGWQDDMASNAAILQQDMLASSSEACKNLSTEYRALMHVSNLKRCCRNPTKLSEPRTDKLVGF